MVFVIKGFCFKGANSFKMILNAKLNYSKSDTESNCFYSSSNPFIVKVFIGR